MTPTRLVIFFDELVESCDGFAVVRPEYNFRIVRVEGARPGGSSVRLDRELHQGARLVSSTEELVWGLSARMLPRQCERISSS